MKMFDIPGDIPKELPVEVHSSGITGKPLILGTCTGSKATQPHQNIKMAIILPTGQWYAPSTVINDAWYCMVLHGIALYCIVLHGIE